MRKLFTLLLTAISSLCAGAQSDSGYNPENPGDPSIQYRLSVEAAPTKGGIANPAGHQFAAPGTEIYCWAEPNPGYTFRQWMSGDSVVSTEEAFTFIMPSHDEALTAHFDYTGYNPENPGDPSADGYSHKITLFASPATGGHFYSPSFYLTEGEQINVYAIPESGYKFEAWKVGDKTVSTDNPMLVRMLDKNQTYTAVFAYSPKSPGEPGANHFDPVTGELLIDNFDSGNLYDAIYSAIGNHNSDKIKSITVIGTLSRNDIYFLRGFSNCATLDISRTTGCTEVPPFFLQGDTSVRKLVLPASVEHIWREAFAQSAVSEISIYATTPPVIDASAFDDVEIPVKIRVPSLSVASYATANEWRNHTILPLDGNEKSLTIRFPDGTDMAKLRNLTLLLQNQQTAQSHRYLLTDRTVYTFTGLTDKSTYQAHIYTANGTPAASADPVYIDTDDMELTFADVPTFHDVTARVLTPDGEDVTAQCTIRWTDADGNYLQQGTNMVGVLAGTTLRCSVTTDETLSLSYSRPDDVSLSVSEQNTTATFTLTPIETLTLHGSVINEKTGIGIANASVVITQQTSGKSIRTTKTITDSKGKYEAKILNLPATATVTAYNFLTAKADIDPAASTSAIALKSLVGAVVNLNFTFTPRRCENDIPHTQQWLNRYTDFVFKLYNVTRGTSMTQVSIRQNELVLLDDITPGDIIRLTVSSSSASFPDAVCEFTADPTQETAITVPLIELGAVEVTAVSSDNKADRCWIYDDGGNCVYAGTFNNKSLLKSLPEGNYDIVAIGQNDILNIVSQKSRLQKIGLDEGNDYVLANTSIRNGILSKVRFENIPAPDVAHLEFLDLDNSRISVNKPSVTAGKYLTLTSKISFSELAEDNIANARMLIDIPESVIYVDGSFMIDNKIASDVTLSGNTLHVPIGTKGVITTKFCVVPASEGECNIGAYIDFSTMKNQTYNVQFGTTGFKVSLSNIQTNSVTTTPNVHVSGSFSSSIERIELYDGETVIGTAIPQSDGTWSIDASLENPYNLTKHNLYAVGTFKNGGTVKTNTKEVTIDYNAISPLSLTMSHYNKWTGHNETVVFDYKTNTVLPEYFNFYQASDFTFVADLSDNSPKKVSAVNIYVFTNDNRIIKCPAKYDPTSDRWIAIRKFGYNSLPVNVSVEPVFISTPAIDRQQITDAENLHDDTHKELTSENVAFEAKIDEVNNLLTDEQVDRTKIDGILTELRGTSYSLSDEDKAVLDGINTYDEWDRYITARIEASDTITDDPIDITPLFDGFNESSSTFTDENGTYSIEYGDCSAFVKSEMTQQGYLEMNTTDDSIIYLKSNDKESIFVDFNKDLSIRIVMASTNLVPGVLKANGMTDLQTRVATITGIFGRIMSVIQGRIDWIEGQIMRQARIVEDVVLDKLMIDAAIDGMPWWESAETERLLKESKRLSDLSKREIRALENLQRFQTLREILSNIGNGISIISTIFDGYQMIKDVQEWDALIATLTPQCDATKDDVAALVQQAYGYGERVLTGYLITLAADIVGLTTMVPAIQAGLISGGSTFPLILINVATLTASIAAEHYLISHSDCWKQQIRLSYGNLASKCKKEDNDDGIPDDEVPDDKKDDVPPPINDDISPIMDPSGFVYEGVAENRLEGVKVTCFYRGKEEDMYGVITEKAMVWDAENYSQENPLYTDERGMYAWDVPQGMWQVKFEKDGYETTYSDWLPVPPPQLDVNIGMRQMKQPEVKSVHAYPDGVVIEFDKYMMPPTLSTENIMVTAGGKIVDGEIQLLDEDAAYGEDASRYASRLRFAANAPFEATEVTVTVANRVMSYAGVRMQDTFSQTFDIEPEITAINATEEIVVPYGENMSVNLSVLPASASAGKTVKIKSMSEMIASAFETECVLDANGRATITLTGHLPGSTAIVYTIDGYDVEGRTNVNVQEVSDIETDVPYASIVSGSEIASGTEIYLYCATPDATIHYTLDGTCPCEISESVKTYSPLEPIIATEGTLTIKAQASKDGFDDSDIATIVYTITPSAIGTILADITTDGANIYTLSGILIRKLAPGEDVVKVLREMPHGIYLLATPSGAIKVSGGR